MERSDILGGNERKTNFEQKAKHCPFAYGAKQKFFVVET